MIYPKFPDSLEKKKGSRCSLIVIPLGLTLSIPNPATGQSYKHKKGPWIENKFSSQSPLYVCDSVGIRARLQKETLSERSGERTLG